MATQSGHVFVRTRNPKTGQSSAAKTFKFQRVPYLQRVIGVCANSTGAFGALRVAYRQDPIHVSGKTASQHLATIQPYLHFPVAEGERKVGPELSALSSSGLSSPTDADDEGEDPSIEKDVQDLEKLFRLLGADKQSRKGPHGYRLFDDVPLSHGADLMVQSSSGSEFPVHRVLLAARSPTLCEVLSGMDATMDAQSRISLRLTSMNKHKSEKSTSSLPRLVIAGCNSMSILILLNYLYSDVLLSLWDNRIAVALEHHLRESRVKPSQVWLELQALARILDLPKLAEAAQSSAKRVPVPSMVVDLRRLFQTTETQGITLMKVGSQAQSPLRPDVIIQLKDKAVYCHSVILRARSALFAAFFDDPDWSKYRWGEDGTIKLDMTQWDWRVLQFPMRYLCSACESSDELFATLGGLTCFDCEQILTALFSSLI